MGCQLCPFRLDGWLLPRYPVLVFTLLICPLLPHLCSHLMSLLTSPPLGTVRPGVQGEKRLEVWHPCGLEGGLFSSEHNMDRQLGSARHMDSSLDFHLFLKLQQLFDSPQGQSQASKDLVLGLPLLSACSCPAVKIHHSHSRSPRLP